MLEHNCIHLKFTDDLEGRVHFQPTAYRGVFGKLRGPAELNKLRINIYFVIWAAELDLAPDAMHEQIKRPGEWILH